MLLAVCSFCLLYFDNGSHVADTSQHWETIHIPSGIFVDIILLLYKSQINHVKQKSKKKKEKKTKKGKSSSKDKKNKIKSKGIDKAEYEEAPGITTPSKEIFNGTTPQTPIVSTEQVAVMSSYRLLGENQSMKLVSNILYPHYNKLLSKEPLVIMSLQHVLSIHYKLIIMNSSV